MGKGADTGGRSAAGGERKNVVQTQSVGEEGVRKRRGKQETANHGEAPERKREGKTNRRSSGSQNKGKSTTR